MAIIEQYPSTHLVRYDSDTAGDPWIADWPPTPLKPPHPGINNGNAIMVNISQDVDPIRTQNTKQEDKVSNKRGLYRVFVVDPEKGEPVVDDVVVASTEAMAQTKAVQNWTLEGDLDDYDFVIVRLGDVRPKPDKD